MAKHVLVRRKIVIIAAILALFIFIWQLPALLKAVPSRYVAAYLPEPVQALVERNHVDMLPTAANPVNVQNFLETQAQKAEDGPQESDVLQTVDTLKDTQVVEPTRVPSGPNLQQDDLNKAPVQNAFASAVTAPTPLVPGLTPTPVPTAVPIPESTRLQDIRHHFQTWNNCGPATLAMGLSYFDIFLTQSQTASVLKPDPEDRNVSPIEMVNYVNQKTDLEALSRVNGDLRLILNLLSEGFPVIIELGLDPPGEYRWMDWYGHYLLLVAYDDSQQKAWVYDSWFGTSEVPGENADPDGREVSYDEIDRYWLQFNRSYIVLYSPEDRSTVNQIIGPETSDASMWQNSLSQAKKEVETDPNNPYLWFNLGTSYNALDEHEMAAGAFDQARFLGLPWRMLWYQFGPYEAYYQVGRYDDVIILADVTLQDRPYFEESYFYKGLALEAKGEIKEARANYEKANSFNPGYVDAQTALKALDN